MQYILEGILFGLSLSILMGPIFIALTQSSIERGQKAGFSVGAGIWISDFLFITLTYTFINSIRSIVEGGTFKLIMGLLGGIVLISFGLYSIIRKVQPIEKNERFTARNYLEYFVKGFLVNTINPFTFVFWITVISTYVLARGINLIQSIQFLGSILFVIVLTDSLKVILAQVLRKKLKLRHLLWINRIAGIALGVFGILLIVWSI